MLICMIVAIFSRVFIGRKMSASGLGLRFRGSFHELGFFFGVGWGMCRLYDFVVVLLTM